MLIQSDFRDYYDSSIAYGVDKSVVFKRNRKDLILNNNAGSIKQPISETYGTENVALLTDVYKAFYSGYEGFRRTFHPNFDEVIVGFCGKIYRGISLNFPITKSNNKSQKVYFTISDLIKDFPKTNWETTSVKFRAIKTPEDWFKNNKDSLVKDDLDFFTRNNIAIFILRDSRLTINPCLKDIGFQRVRGSIEAFSELNMFISGPMNEITTSPTEMTDKVMAESKGFDKYSFKKPKS